MNNFPVVYAVFPKILKKDSYSYNVVYSDFIFSNDDIAYYTIMKCFLLDATISYKPDGTISRKYSVVNVYDVKKDCELKSYAREKCGITVNYLFTNLEAARLFKNMKNKEIDKDMILQKISQDCLQKYKDEDELLEEKSIHSVLELKPGFQRIKELFKNEI